MARAPESYRMDLNRCFCEQDTTLQQIPAKMCNIREHQNNASQPTVGPLHAHRVAENSKCWQGCGETESSHTADGNVKGGDVSEGNRILS